jgi:hypothetical protein
MVQPNVNIKRLDMSRVTGRGDVQLLINASMVDTTKASENIPNLDEKFSFLP